MLDLTASGGKQFVSTCTALGYFALWLSMSIFILYTLTPLHYYNIYCKNKQTNKKTVLICNNYLTNVVISYPSN